jgi:RNA polymerase sigma factor (sigma-70 family)
MADVGRSTGSIAGSVDEPAQDRAVTGHLVTTTAAGAAEIETQLTAFFADHYDRLVRLAGLICHSPSTVEDAVQMAMERAWRQRHSLRDPSRLKPWLDQIVVRQAIRTNRRPWWNRLGRSAGPDEAASIAHPGTTIDPTIVALTVALRALPAKQRAAIALHLYAGHTVEETATLMGSGIETTRSRLRLARQRLRRELTEEDQ